MRYFPCWESFRSSTFESVGSGRAVSLHRAGTLWWSARYVFGVSAFPAQELAAERHPAAGTNPLRIFWDSRKRPIRMCWCNPGTDKEIPGIEERFPYLWFILCSSSPGISLLRKNFLRSDFIPLWDFGSAGLRLVFHRHLPQEPASPTEHKFHHGKLPLAESPVESCAWWSHWDVKGVKSTGL